MSEHLIEVKDLKKYYNKGEIKALDGVSVNIDKGDVMVVIGPSGSGKSTFLRSLNLLEEPTGGSIVFDGVDITRPKYRKVDEKTGKTVTVKLDIDQHRRKMGMVFQHFNLFPHMTILENMTLAPVEVKHVPRAQAEEKALRLLARVGLGDRADAYPIQLSGGQKQRVAIVRALAMDVVTHEMGFAREVGNRVLFMADGRLLEQGSPADIFERPQNPRLRDFLSKVL